MSHFFQVQEKGKEMDVLQDFSLLEQAKVRFQSFDTRSSLYKVRSSWWQKFLSLHAQGTTSCKWGAATRFAERVCPSLQEIEPFILPECRNSVLVLVNGYFEPTLSQTSGIHPKVVVQSMERASKVYGALLGQESSHSIEQESHCVCALHEALAQDGLFLYVPPKIEAGPPIQILLYSVSAEQITLPKLVIASGAHTRLQLVLSYHSLGTVSGENVVLSTDLRIEEEASVQMLESGLEGLHFIRTKVKRGGRFTSFLGSSGSSCAFYRHHLSLLGEGAEVSLEGLFLPSHKKEMNCQIQVEHHVPHCRSYQKFKGVVQDVSRARFAGKIFVRSAAQKTEAFQKNQFLLLGERAFAESCPGLEIFADDVKASHGATIGQIDAEQLFYLQARGIHESVAKGLIVAGFCEDCFASIFVPSLDGLWRQQASLCT